MDVIPIDMSGENILMFTLKRCISNLCRNLMSNIRISNFTVIKGNDHVPGKVVLVTPHGTICSLSKKSLIDNKHKKMEEAVDE